MEYLKWSSTRVIAMDAFCRVASRIVLVFCVIIELQTTAVRSSVGDEELKRHDHCIIGAGPGGLQLAHFLQKASRDYIVFERNSIPGSFYAKYPRHRKLISINKRFTGETNSNFNMRHDWNSLLSDDPTLLFRFYSSDFYPSADVMTVYLQDYARKLNLSIQYNTEVHNILKYNNGGEYVFKVEEKKTEIVHICRTVILATGLSKPNKLSIFRGNEHLIGYEDVSTNPADFTGKTVLILGRGNAAFETADSMSGETNFIHMIGRSRARLAWSTHYVGDLRAINNVLLDNYQLKSLDGVLENQIEMLSIAKDKSGKLYFNFTDAYNSKCDKGTISLFSDNFPLRKKYDYVIRCLGFVSDMSPFHSSTKPTTNGKYAVLKNHYESVNIPGLYVAGTLSHQLDYRKSAGGFIHGFRYTARALFRILEQRYHNQKWKSRTVHFKDLINCIVKRLNDADGLYQMFGVLGDVWIIDKIQETAKHFEEYPIKSVQNFARLTGEEVGNKSILLLNYEYGQNFSGPGKDTFMRRRAVGQASRAHKSNFLHPVLYFYEKLPSEMTKDTAQSGLPQPSFLHHVVEDFLTDFTAQIAHITPIRRFIEHILQVDLRTFNSEACLTEMLTSQSLPQHCYLQVSGSPTSAINFAY